MKSLELKVIPVVQAMIAVVLMIIVKNVTEPTPWLQATYPWLFRGFMLLGAIIGIWGVISFKRAQTTVNPSQPNNASTLVSSGIYRVTRNPMYLGLVCFLFAVVVKIGHIAAIVIIPLFMIYMTIFQIKPEERALTQLFQQQYIDYCKKVRRWL